MDYTWVMRDSLHTVVELPEFRRAANRLLTEAEIGDLVYYLAQHPTVGDVIRGSGGVRKVRWAREGRGKRGGARVVTFYTGADLPLFLITVYAKGEKDTLSGVEVGAMRKLTAVLKESYGRLR